MSGGVHFPHRSLKDCEEFALTAKELGPRNILQSSIAKRFGYDSLKSGGWRGFRAAAGYFGLIDVSSATHLSLSADAIASLAACDSLPQSFLKSAMQKPALFRTIISQYDGKQMPEQAQLAFVLRSSAQLKLTREGANVLAQVFLESARHAGILDDRGFLHLDGGDNPPALPETPELPFPASTAPPAPMPASPQHHPTVHIDLQIHIPPDMDEGKIDAIFASIAKHLR